MRKDVDRRDLLGDARRMLKSGRHQHDPEPEPDVLGDT